jgi:hypothetical protein
MSETRREDTVISDTQIHGIAVKLVANFWPDLNDEEREELEWNLSSMLLHEILRYQSVVVDD